ncbi:MAG: phenylalanine--tRNA ligase subunit beta [Desulfobacteraceae bacterium 4572_19]|nr:MAG: phenylalanine--tRNA ligase subunit beta [Desulfobacteraceae bacterium 4572_19]
MKVSLSWLKEYIDIKMSVADLADALTMAGLEVEAVEDRFSSFNNIVVGQIIKTRQHANADRLKCCKVNIGNEEIAVVCGAPNAKEGMYVACALPGAALPNGITIKKSKLRGEKSEGMLCSGSELELGVDSDGIMALDNSLVPGTSLVEALNLSDYVIEIDLTPNRPDCLSIAGVAREVKAIQNSQVPIRFPDAKLPDASSDYDNIEKYTSVIIDDPQLCYRYVAKLVFDIKVAPSPFWLQDHLISVGLKPINNVVDVTNLVMMETGQPLHAFDFDNLAGNKIIVRSATEGEKFTTLDDKEHIMESGALMICDGEKPVAIAGVMGGLNSEISDSTVRILIEGAYFKPSSIRKTAKKTGIGTDASHRFERGVDPAGTVHAVNRAAKLITEITGGSLIQGIIDNNPVEYVEKTVLLDPMALNRRLGTTLSSGEIKKFLESIEFGVSPVKTCGELPDKSLCKPVGDKLAEEKLVDNSSGLLATETEITAKTENFIVSVPSFRVDVSRPEDLSEEIARLWGYNNIKTSLPLVPVDAKPSSRKISMRNKVKRIMTGLGMSEAINYSFIHVNSCDRLCLPENDIRRNVVKVLNPISEDQAILRTSLVPGLLDNMQRNLSMQVNTLKLFEAGNIFFNQGEAVQPKETEMLTGLLTGARNENRWYAKGEVCDFFDLKGILEGLFTTLKITDFSFVKYDAALCTFTLPNYTAQVFINNKEIGIIGKIAPDVLKNYSIKQAGYVFELNLETLTANIPDAITSLPIPKFPSVSRDITLLVAREIGVADILKAVNNSDEKLVVGVHLFDVYEGEPIATDRKSVSLRVIYRSDSCTLKDKRINKIHAGITKGLIKKFKAELP